MTTVVTLNGVLRLDDSDFRSGMRNAKGEMNSFGTRMRGAADNVRDFGQRMTVATAPIAAYLGGAVVATQNFNRSMSNVNAILQLSSDEAADLREEILAYGATTVAGPQAVADAYYAIVSGVQDASTHMAILEAATRTSEAGQADLMATTSGLISTMNSYGFAAQDAAFVSDVFSRTVQMGVLTMDELATAFPQVTGLAAQFNIPLTEMGGSLAYLTTQGFSAAQSATFLKSMMTTLLNPTTDLSAAITSLGYDSGAALLEAEGLVGAYQLLSDQNGGLDGLITNSEALQGALALTQDAANSFLDDYVAGVDGATERAGLIQDETESWDLLKSGLSALQIEVGTALMPVLLDLTDNYIRPAIGAVLDWINENPELTGQIVALGAALVVAGPIIGLVGAAIGLLLSPVGILAAGFAGIIAVLETTQEGGVIGSVGRMITTLNQLRVLGIMALNSAATWLNTQLTNMGINVDDLRNRILGLNTTWNQLATITGAVVSGEVNVNDVVTAVSNEINGTTQQVGGTGRAGNPVGGRAGGGHVNSGVPMMVGEREPEVFVPSVPGEIYNQNQMGEMGGGINIQNVTIHANSKAEGRAAGQGFYDEIQELTRGRGVRTGAI